MTEKVGEHNRGRDDIRMRAAMISFRVEGVESSALQGHLSRTQQIRTRVIEEYDYGWMRLSTHIYNGPDDIERVLELLADVARDGIPMRG